jgi:hypothetical protein
MIGNKKNSFKFTFTILKFIQMKKFYFLIISLLFVLQAVDSNAQCLMPTQLSVTANTQNSVTVSWATTNSSSHYNIRYQTPGSLNWIVLNNVNSPLTLTGLNCGSTYVGQLQQVCYQAGVTTPLFSDWANITFTTFSCTTNTCPAPTGLVSTNMSQTGVVLNLSPTASTNNLYNIRYHTGTTTWATVTNITLPYQLGNLPCGTGFEWQVQQVCASSSPTSALLSPWSAGSTFSTLACISPCTTPTGSATTNITSSGAILNWNPNIIAIPAIYNIRYHAANSTTWITINNVPAPYQLSNLTCGTGYVWQIQQVCSTNAEPSPWSVGTTFSTLACTNLCATPVALEATNISQTGAFLHWGPITTTGGLYNIRYHTGNSTTWIVLNNVSMPYQLGNLACGTVYEWQVQQICSTTPGTISGLSLWSAGAVFTTLACANPCLAPTGQTTTNITQTGAVLNWIGNTLANNLYNIRYHSANSTTWIVINNVTSPYHLDNLPCSNGFVWQVQQICNTAAEPSPWSVGTTFSTLQCPNPCLTPIGLTATNIAQTSVVLSLGTNTSPNNVYNIRYHSGNSTTWITINNITFPYQLGNLPCGTVFEWQAQQICSPATGTTTGLSTWSPASIFTTLACPTPCPAPMQLSVVTSQNGAVVSWAIPNTLVHYNVQYHMDGNPNWTILNNVSSPLSLTGLNCGAVYILQVQQVCSNSTGAVIVSPWANVTFTTLSCQNPCAVPVALETTNISQTGAFLHWGPVATGGLYNLRYHIGNSTTWIVLNNVTMPYQLGNLTCGTLYEWQVQRICSNSTPSTQLSAWSTAAVFTTMACTNPNPCETPTGLSTTNITQSSAVLHWGAVTTTSNLYNIRYHSANSTTWIVVNNVTMPYQLGNLNCSAGYVWQVQRICGTASGTNSELSPWSIGATFSTSPCIIPCAAPIGLSANDVTQTSAILHWGVVSGAVAYVVSYRPLNTTSPFITLTTNTNSILISGLNVGSVYTYQVRAICANGTIATNMSPLSVPYVFTTLSALVVFPNPANEILKMSVNVNSISTVTIQLRDSYGQLVSSVNETAAEGQNEFKINTSGVSEGLYLLTIKTNSDTLTSKVFVKH